MTGPRHEETWRKVAGPRPSWAWFAAVGLACLVLGAVLSAWALRLL